MKRWDTKFEPVDVAARNNYIQEALTWMRQNPNEDYYVMWTGDMFLFASRDEGTGSLEVFDTVVSRHMTRRG
jgi:hypothetical protein